MIAMGESTKSQPAPPVGAVSYDSLLLGWEGDTEELANEMDWETESGKGEGGRKGEGERLVNKWLYCFC